MEEEVETLTAPKSPKTSVCGEIINILEVILSSIVIVVILFTFFFKVVTIDGRSMVPTLFDGEKLIISNLAYEPQYGDIVVVSRNVENTTSNNSTQPIIKRVIAVEGQTVDIDFDAGVVYVDGKALDEPYTNTPTNLKYDIDFPVRVDEGYVFCLGDNRNDSLDSRSSRIGENGLINKKYILGRSIIRILPFSKFGKVS